MKKIGDLMGEFLEENPEYKNRFDVDMAVIELTSKLMLAGGNKEAFEGYNAVKKIKMDNEKDVTLKDFIELAHALNKKITIEDK